MKNSKLLTLLEKLDGFQLRSLHTFISSPFYNTNEDVSRLYDYLHECHRKGLSDELPERVAAYKHLFPGEPYQYQRLNQLMSLLLKLVEKWLAVQLLEEDEALLESLKARKFLMLNLDKHFYQAQRSVEKALQKNPPAAEHYYYAYQMKELAEQHFTSSKSRKHHPALQQASDALDDFYVLQKLRYACEMLNRQRLTDHQYRFSLEPTIAHYFQEHGHTGKLLLNLYYLLYSLLSADSPASSSFDEYVSLLRDNSEQLDKTETQSLWYYAINYCIGKIREGDRPFASRLFNLYDQGIKKGILLDNGQLSPWTFKNMVKLGLNLKRYDWVESFVTTYADYLPEQQKEGALHYNLAELYFFQGKYEAALSQLRYVEFTDIHYNLGSRALLAKIYYEQGEWDALEALLTAFQVFLRRNKTISKKVKNPYRNFARTLSAMLRRLPQNYGELIKKVKQEKAIDNRDWLLRQMETS